MEERKDSNKRERWLGELLRTGKLDITRGDFWADFLGLQFVAGVVGWCVVGDLLIRWFP